MKILQRLALLAALICFSSSLFAQRAGPANLTAQGSTCGASSTSSLTVTSQFSNVGAAAYSVSGNAGTVSFYVSLDTAVTATANSTWQPFGVTKSDGSSSSAVTSTTSNGDWSAPAAGYRSFCVMATSYSSGTVVTSINLSTASARANSGGGASPNNNCSTAGAISYFAATGIVTSCDPGITSNGSGQLSAAGGFVSPGDGVHTGSWNCSGNTTLPTLPSNSAQIDCPLSSSFTSWRLQFPILGPGSEVDGVTTTQTDGWKLANTTLGTLSVPQQNSPALHFIGHSWQTASSGDQQIDFYEYVQSITGSFGYPILNWYATSNGGGPNFAASLDAFGDFIAGGYLQSATTVTASNCKANGTAANPSVASCGSASAGMFSCSTAATAATCQVNTTAVTANSEIQIIQDAADGASGQLNVTCETTSSLPSAKPLLLSKSGGSSFTISLGTVTTNPACFEYAITN